MWSGGFGFRRVRGLAEGYQLVQNWDAGTPGCRLQPGVANPCLYRLDSFDRIGLDVPGVVR